MRPVGVKHHTSITQARLFTLARAGALSALAIGGELPVFGDVAFYTAQRLQKGRIPKVLLASNDYVQRFGEDVDATLHLLLENQPDCQSKPRVHDELLELVAEQCGVTIDVIQDARLEAH